MPSSKPLLLALLLGALACTETNPNSCLVTPSVCKEGTRCVKGTDSQGRVWSACMASDGGEGDTGGASGEGGDTGGEGGATGGKGGADAGPDAPAGGQGGSNSTASLDGGTETGTTACSDGMTRSCAADGLLGNCAKGTETCAAGKWGTCSVTAQGADRCDVMGDDANCNGQPNEGCPCVTGDKQPCGPAMEQGICKKGTQTCSNAQWGPCQGAVMPKPRDCTSPMDNDCDGKPDNTVDGTCQCNPVNGTRPCGTHPQDGTGECHAGMQTCVAGTGNASTKWGTCTGSVGPASSDTCVAGNDANCNGVPNEGCKELGGKCSSNGDCLSGHCVMGTCCGSACPVAAVSTCGNDGTCDSTGTCRKYANGTVCSPASCSNLNNAHESSTCQAGSCKPGKQCDYHGCDDNKKCTSICPGSTNDTGTQCEHCGNEGEHCCGVDLCSGSGIGCIMSTFDGMKYCTKCGDINQRCCPTGTDCRNGQCLPTKVGPPACQNCGLLGQICCQGMQCSQGTCGMDAIGFPVCK